MRVYGRILIASLLVAAVVAGCKTPMAGGNAGAGGADGGMASGMGGAGASPASSMTQSPSAAAQGTAEAGAAGAKEATDAATTAAEAARSAAGNAKAAAATAASPAMDAGTAAMGSGAAAPPASDAQIAAIAGAANQGDILKSRLAKKRSKNAKVKEFANLMIKDHSALDAQAKKLGIAPEENDMSRALTQGAQDALTKLTPLKGKEFDTAYVDIQVASHEKVLKALDDALIPSAKDPGLKALLQTARAKVQMHLEHAQQLQAALAK